MAGMTRWVVAVGVAVAMIPGARGEVAAQLPDEFTNLKHFREDIGQRELVNYMRGAAIGLGVRCTFCHVGEEGQPFSTYDFASDEKATKLKAREMFRMVEHINGEVLAVLPERTDPNLEVSCVTCHSGRSRPSTLADELNWAADEGGSEAMRARYAELREEYYGLGSFNFGPGALDAVASRLAGADRSDEALAAAELNIEFNPESASTWGIKGQLHQQAGETEEAIQAFERSLEIAPQNRQIRQLMEQLKAGWAPSSPTWSTVL